MAEIDYKVLIGKAKNDLLATQKELGETYKKQEELEKKITGLRAIIAAMARMLDEEFVEEDAMGLTDAIREAFRSAGISGNLTPTEIKGKLEMMGYDTAKYGNVMASVHTIINRLVNQKEVKEIGKRGDKPAYQMTDNLKQPTRKSFGQLLAEDATRRAFYGETGEKKLSDLK
jgi:hypothetical protein